MSKTQEFVLPSDEVIADQVKEQFAKQDARSEANGTAKPGRVLHKTSVEEIMKDNGIPTQVVKQSHALEGKIVLAVANLVGEDLANKIAKEKKKGTDLAELKKMSEDGKVITPNGNVKITVNASSVYPNPKDPGKQIHAIGAARLRVANAFDPKVLRDNEYVEKLRKLLQA